MPDASLPTSTSRRRPITLFILAGLLLLRALIVLAVLAGAVAGDFAIGEALRIPGVSQQIRDTPGAGVVLAAVAALLVLSALGLLTNRRAGWLLAMVTTGVFIALDLYAFTQGIANHLWMALNIVTVFYLNQRDVRERVGDAMPLPAREPARW